MSTPDTAPADESALPYDEGAEAYRNRRLPGENPYELQRPLWVWVGTK